jgi:hypothetical protein
MAGYEKLSKAAADIVASAATGIKESVIRYVRPPQVETYHPSSELFQEEVGKSEAYHRNITSTWTVTESTFKKEMTDLEEQATELAHTLDNEQRIIHELMKAVALHKINVKRLGDQKKKVDGDAAEKLAEHEINQTKYLISVDRINKNIKIYSSMTCEQVRSMENLDDPIVWETMTVVGCKTKFNRLEAMCWQDSPHCPLKDVQKERLKSYDSQESKASYVGRLKQYVWYIDQPLIAAAAAPAPVVPNPFVGVESDPLVATTTHHQQQEMSDEERFAQLCAKLGKRKVGALLTSIAEGDEQEQADNDNSGVNGDERANGAEQVILPPNKRARTE